MGKRAPVSTETTVTKEKQLRESPQSLEVASMCCNTAYCGSVAQGESWILSAFK